MAEQTIKLGGKEFTAVLSLEALERIEGTFNNESLGTIIARTAGGIRAGKAILTSCISESTPTATVKMIHAAIDKEVTENGVDAIWEIVKTLVEASGFYGKKKAKDANLGN